jgi:hypothetical protein
MKKTLLIVTAILCATPAFAADDTAAREKDRKFFTFGDHAPDDTISPTEHRDCKSPSKPTFITDLPFSEQRLPQAVYLAEVAKSILSTKTCSCEMLYPTYDHAIEVYKRYFLPMGLPAKPGSKEQAYIGRYIDEASKSYDAAANMCIALGVY